eukprot:753948-Hanusia_phi.AAC.4
MVEQKVCPPQAYVPAHSTHPTQGPDILLEAVPQILANNSEARIVFVGGGHMLPDLKQRALVSTGPAPARPDISVQTLGVSHAVHFLGSASGDPLKMYEKACDILVSPGRSLPVLPDALLPPGCSKSERAVRHSRA